MGRFLLTSGIVLQYPVVVTGPYAGLYVKQACPEVGSSFSLSCILNVVWNPDRGQIQDH